MLSHFFGLGALSGFRAALFGLGLGMLLLITGGIWRFLASGDQPIDERKLRFIRAFAFLLCLVGGALVFGICGSIAYLMLMPI